VVLTSSDAENDVARSFELRADGFLTKPAEADTLPKLFSRLGFLGGVIGAEPLSRPNLHCPQ
jgi:DNA-binding NarL/FixJ family response regulator